MATTLQPPRRIETARLVLEPQVAAHAEEMFTVLGDPAIYTYENQPPPSLDWLRARFERLESRRSADGSELWLNWVVRLRPAPLIGYVQATVLPQGRALIAYEFASSHWGLGLAREAAEALMRELGERYSVTHLTAVAKRANVRSLRLLQRLGFVLVEDAAAGHALEADEILASRPATVP